MNAIIAGLSIVLIGLALIFGTTSDESSYPKMGDKVKINDEKVERALSFYGCENKLTVVAINSKGQYVLLPSNCKVIKSIEANTSDVELLEENK